MTKTPVSRTCCFCAYTGTERRFRNVGVDGYPDDCVCHLCDTETDGDVPRWETNGGAP